MEGLLEGQALGGLYEDLVSVLPATAMTYSLLACAQKEMGNSPLRFSAVRKLLQVLHTSSALNSQIEHRQCRFFAQQRFETYRQDILQIA